MTESTGLPASTIHRLLGLNGRESNDVTGTKDIEGSLLIIDEMSMVDTYLFRSLVRAIPNHMQVVLVGIKISCHQLVPDRFSTICLSPNKFRRCNLIRFIDRKAARQSFNWPMIFTAGICRRTLRIINRIDPLFPATKIKLAP